MIQRVSALEVIDQFLTGYARAAKDRSPPRTSGSDETTRFAFTFRSTADTTEHVILKFSRAAVATAESVRNCSPTLPWALRVRVHRTRKFAARCSRTGRRSNSASQARAISHSFLSR